jgi:hypothetical protein
MAKKLVFVKAVFLVAIVFILAAVVVLMRDKQATPTGRAVIEQPDAYDNTGSVSIGNDEMTKCCTFQNSEGKDDACFVLKRYDCSYCDLFCKK